MPKRLTVMEQSINVSEYLKKLDRDDWEEIKVRQTAKGSLKGLYHFAKVYIWDKNENRVEERMLVIRRVRNKSGEEIKYSFVS